jgi:hypothetical protein
MKPDDRLWAEVREAAAPYGFNDAARPAVLKAAQARILKRKLWDQGQHALRVKLEALWQDRAVVMGAN